jgi:hypothetical protein
MDKLFLDCYWDTLRSLFAKADWFPYSVMTLDLLERNSKVGGAELI